MEHSEGYRHIRRDRKVPPPRKIETWADAYVSLRESLGFHTRELRMNLRTLIAFMRERGIGSFAGLDRRSAASWLRADSVQEMTVIVRLACMRGFFRYLVGLGQVKENVWDAFANPRPKPFRPYIFPLAELRAVLEKARAEVKPARPMGSHVSAAYYAMFHTVYACGLRTCEACGLDIGDMDLERSLFVVRDTKFGKTRLVPFNTRTRGVVSEYLNRFRPADDGMPPEAPLFLSLQRRRFRRKNVTQHFSLLCKRAGIYRPKRTEGNTVFGGTTTHALRHSFAVHRILKWYEEGADVNAKLPLLATYMGHTHYHHTQKYMTVLPAIIDMAGKRFAEKFEKPLRDLEWPGGA